MSPSDETERAAELIERLLTDVEFRARFRDDPAGTCHEHQLHGLADEIARSEPTGMQTLEVRESKSSLAGVILAAAAEGIGAVELAQLGVRHGGFTGQAAKALGRAFASPKIPALSPAQLRKAGLGPLPVPHVPHVAGVRTPHLPAAPHLPVVHPPHAPSPAREVQRALHQASHPSPPHASPPSPQVQPSSPAPSATPVHPAATAPPAAPATPPQTPAQHPVDAVTPSASPGSASAGADQSASASPGGGSGAGAAADAAASAPASPSPAASGLLSNPHVTLSPDAVTLLQQGTADPRVVDLLTQLSQGHSLTVSAMPGPDAVDIGAVDGQPVAPGTIVARDLAQAIAALPAGEAPAHTGTPWPISAPGFYTDASVQDHIHLEFDAAASAESASAPPPGAPPAPQPDASAAGGQSAVFAAITRDPPPSAARATVQVLSALSDPPGAGARGGAPLDPAHLTARAAATDAVLAAPLTPGADAYPGDTASKEEIAAWMARRAHAAGLPSELPVMASLVESGLYNNPNQIDHDSVGYFQMRVGTWNEGPYAGFQTDPEKQIKWFIDEALAVRQHRIAQGYANYGENPATWGTWIADVERPLAAYRGRYQLRLADAQALLADAAQHQAPSEAASGAGGAVAGAADAAFADLPADQQGSPQAEHAVEAMMKYIGTPYSWGGGGLDGPSAGFAQGAGTVGFDCSSLMRFGYHQVGVDLARTTYDQVKEGIPVDRAHLRVGDLLFFASGSDIHHVGVYIGDGKFLHAPHTGDVIKVSSLSIPYYDQQFYGARRMVAAA